MGKEPKNILRLKRENDRFADASQHARDLQVCGCNAEWFTRDFEQSNKTELTAQSKDFFTKESSVIERHKIGAKDQIAQELDSANKVVAALRKDKLRCAV
jgi:hypothetical protein